MSLSQLFSSNLLTDTLLTANQLMLKLFTNNLKNNDDQEG